MYNMNIYDRMFVGLKLDDLDLEINDSLKQLKSLKKEIKRLKRALEKKSRSYRTSVISRPSRPSVIISPPHVKNNGVPQPDSSDGKN